MNRYTYDAFHGSTFEEMVDEILELRDDNDAYSIKITDLKSDIEDLESQIEQLKFNYE